MVDHDLLQAAINAYLKIDRAGRVIDEAMAAAIEAYEAARPEPNPWRPIDEAPRDGTVICVWWAAGKGPIRDYPENMEFLWWERDCWISDLGGRALNHSGCVDVGAMFRTIDPPTQNAVSSGMEGASDDESNKPFISVHDELSEPGDRRMDQETPRSKS